MYSPIECNHSSLYRTLAAQFSSLTGYEPCTLKPRFIPRFLGDIIFRSLQLCYIHSVHRAFVCFSPHCITMVSESQSHCIQPHNGNNYTTWSEEMKALLRSKGLWRLVDGKERCPTTGDKEQEAWDIKQDRAAGELMLNLMPDQRVHIRASQDDPTAA